MLMLSQSGVVVNRRWCQQRIRMRYRAWRWGHDDELVAIVLLRVILRRTFSVVRMSIVVAILTTRLGLRVGL